MAHEVVWKRTLVRKTGDGDWMMLLSACVVCLASVCLCLSLAGCETQSKQAVVLYELPRHVGISVDAMPTDPEQPNPEPSSEDPWSVPGTAMAISTSPGTGISTSLEMQDPSRDSSMQPSSEPSSEAADSAAEPDPVGAADLDATSKSEPCMRVESVKCYAQMKLSDIRTGPNSTLWKKGPHPSSQSLVEDFRTRGKGCLLWQRAKFESHCDSCKLQATVTSKCSSCLLSFNGSWSIRSGKSPAATVATGWGFTPSETCECPKDTHTHTRT